MGGVGGGRRRRRSVDTVFIDDVHKKVFLSSSYSK